MKEVLDFLVLGIIMGIVATLGLLLRDRYNRNLAEIRESGKTYSNKQIFIGMLILLPLGLYLILNIPINWLVPFEFWRSSGNNTHYDSSGIRFHIL